MPDHRQLVWVFCIVAVAVPSIAVAVIFTARGIANAWERVRRGEQEAALKREMLQRGLGVEDIERVLRDSSKEQAKPAATPAPSPEQQALEEMVTTLGENGVSVSGPVLEEALATIRDADPVTQQAICRTVSAMVTATVGAGEEVKDEQILGVVRGLRRPARSAQPSALAPSLEPAPKPQCDETFQPLRPV
jgi:hypothetical protein